MPRVPAKSPPRWGRLTGPLVPPDRLLEIESAVRLVARSEGEGQPSGLVERAIPELGRFEGLVEDAFDLIGGDVGAHERFTRGLGLLEGAQASVEPVDAEALDRWVEGLRGLGVEHPPEHVVPEERLAPVLFAAAYAGLLEPGAPDRYLAVVLRQLSGFEALDTLWKAARRALEGQPRDVGHFEDVLGLSDAFPFDGGFPPFPPPPKFDKRLIPGSWLKHVYLCALEARQKTIPSAQPQVKLPPYSIASISPATGCAGTKLVLTGTNFGTDVGKVVFPRAGAVSPVTWADTSIEVNVPPGATCGTVGLAADPPESAPVSVCGKVFEGVAWPGTGAYFGGSEVDIRSFTVNGRTTDQRVSPGSTITLAWSVCPTSNSLVALEIRDYYGTVLLSTAVAAAGTRTFTVHSTDKGDGNHLKCTLTATNPCRPSPLIANRRLLVGPPADLTVTGMEVTQAIQYYKSDQHLTDPLDRAPTNSLELVAYKTTWVRVYVDSGVPSYWGSGRVANVDAVLEVSRISGSGASTSLGSRSPWDNVAAYSVQPYGVQRWYPEMTLNFQIPAWWCAGTLRFRVELNPARTIDETNYANNSATETISFSRHRWLELRGVFFADPPRLHRSWLGDLLDSTWWLERAFPVGAVYCKDAGTVIVTNPADWNFSFAKNKVLDARLAAGNPPDAVFVGVLPASAPLPSGPGTPAGLGDVGWAVVTHFDEGDPWDLTISGDAQVLAHEVGHGLGLGHAPAGVPAGYAGLDPNYPAYEPYDSSPTDPTRGRIGEYGWDVVLGPNARGNPVGPAGFPPTSYMPSFWWDFMSYREPEWISLYHYRKLLSAAAIQSATVQPSAGFPSFSPAPPRLPSNGDETTRRQPVDAEYLYALGTIDLDGRINLDAVRQVRGQSALVGDRDTPYRVVLEGAGGRELASAAITSSAEPTGREFPLGFLVSLPVVEGVERAVIERDQERVHVLEVPRQAPQVEITELVLEGEHARLSWRADSPEGRELEYWVRFSADGGSTWQPLTVGLIDTQYEASLSELSGGSACLLQVAAHDGFHSVYSTSEPFELPLRPPRAVIVTPQSGARLSSGRGVVLRGQGLSPQEGPLPIQALHWSSDRVGELGFGSQLTVDELPIGAHRLRLVATDSEGRTGEAEIEVEIRGENQH